MMLTGNVVDVAVAVRTSSASSERINTLVVYLLETFAEGTLLRYSPAVQPLDDILNFYSSVYLNMSFQDLL